MKKQLENKKNQTSTTKGKKNTDLSTKKMKSQQAKKTSNTRRKMGVYAPLPLELKSANKLNMNSKLALHENNKKAFT